MCVCVFCTLKASSSDLASTTGVMLALRQKINNTALRIDRMYALETSIDALCTSTGWMGVLDYIVYCTPFNDNSVQLYRNKTKWLSITILNYAIC